jgi:hypothetical protein
VEEDNKARMEGGFEKGRNVAQEERVCEWVGEV